jgi:hypothetical protein
MLTSVKPLFSVDGKVFSLTIRIVNGPSNTQTTIGSPSIATIADFNDMVNTMLSAAHTFILPGADKPYIYYQPENKLFYLVYPGVYQAANVEILFNQTLYTYLSGFPADRLPNYVNNEDWYRLKLKALPDDGY